MIELTIKAKAVEQEQTDELTSWLQRNTTLHVAMQSGCSKHGFLVLVFRTGTLRDINVGQRVCLGSQLGELHSEVVECRWP